MSETDVILEMDKHYAKEWLKDNNYPPEYWENPTLLDAIVGFARHTWSNWTPGIFFKQPNI